MLSQDAAAAHWGVVGKCRRHKSAKYSTQGNVDHFRHTQLLSSFAREAVSGTRGTSSSACLAATSDAAAACLLTATLWAAVGHD